jgi:tight adherence protein C
VQIIAVGISILAISALYVSLGNSGESKLTERLTPRKRIFRKQLGRTKFSAVSALMEIPDFASLLLFAVSAGESLESALRLAVSRSTGYVSGEFDKVLRNVEHGALLQIELQELVSNSKSEQVRELATKLAVALNNGSALGDLLTDFVQSSTFALRAELLIMAGRNETKMMIPMVFIILPITVMFALFPSLALIQGSFL